MVGRSSATPVTWRHAKAARWPLFQRGRRREALPELHAAWNEGPSRPEVASAYALLLIDAGRSEEAALVLEKAVERFPEDVGLLHNLEFRQPSHGPI